MYSRSILIDRLSLFWTTELRTYLNVSTIRHVRLQITPLATPNGITSRQACNRFQTRDAIFLMQISTVVWARTLFVFWLWGFYTVCEVNLPTTFRKPLWVSSSLVTSRNKNNETTRCFFVQQLQEAAYWSGYSYFYLWPVKMGPTAVFETSSVNLPRTPCINPEAKKRYSTHGESLQSGRYLFSLTALHSGISISAEMWWRLR